MIMMMAPEKATTLAKKSGRGAVLFSEGLVEPILDATLLRVMKAK